VITPGGPRSEKNIVGRLRGCRMRLFLEMLGIHKTVHAEQALGFAFFLKKNKEKKNHCPPHTPHSPCLQPVAPSLMCPKGEGSPRADSPKEQGCTCNDRGGSIESDRRTGNVLFQIEGGGLEDTTPCNKTVNNDI